jgi:hypothetical protein
LDAWIVILAIALLRGLGAWMRRRNKKQQQEAGSGARRPQPGDPDAFDLEGMDPLEDEEFSWETSSKLPERQTERKPETTRRLPDIPSPRRRESESPGVVLSDTERKRQERLQQLAQVAAEAEREARQAARQPARKQRHPVAASGARISHDAERAAGLRWRLRSPGAIRHAWLLREVLGPPVALRGPLRRPGDLQPR